METPVREKRGFSSALETDLCPRAGRLKRSGLHGDEDIRGPVMNGLG
jgi:hypothetical protein